MGPSLEHIFKTFISFSIYTSNATYINIPCVTRSGTPSVSCNVGETMVSCGFDQDGVQGTWIDSDNICTAYPSAKTAKARCCSFPSDAISDVFTESSSSAVLVQVNCPSNTFLTGCDPRYTSGTIKRFKGSWSGSSSSPPNEVSNTWIDTQNICHSESWSVANIKAGARCLSLSSLYTLECKTKIVYAAFSNFGKCETGYSMMACNAWTDYEINGDNLDLYYVDDNDACKVRQTDFKPLYANAICCRLFKGISAITHIPTNDPSVGPSYYPTNDPTNRLMDASNTKNTEYDAYVNDDSNTNEWELFYLVGSATLVCVLFVCLVYGYKNKMCMNLELEKQENIVVLEKAQHVVPDEDAPDEDVKGELSAFNLKKWLEEIGLIQYYDVFVGNGYESLMFIKDIEDKVQLEEINIMNTLHQIQIMNAINKYKLDNGMKQEIKMVQETGESEGITMEEMSVSDGNKDHPTQEIFPP